MIDLHVHSIYSDGEYEPLKILELCNEREISTISITDHNSMEGSKFAISHNPYPNIKVISGVELSAKYPIKGGNLHILGYGIDLENEELNQVTEAIMADNIRRLDSLVYLLKKHYNLSFKEQDLERIYEAVGDIGRPDIARLCVKYGYTNTVAEAFERYFNPIHDMVAKHKVELTAKECIEYIQRAGGISCLAHPIELKKDTEELKKFILELMSYGLSAVEVYQSKHSAQYSKQLLKIVDEYGLLYSVGSDYHGPVTSPKFEMGYGQNNNLNMQTATILSKVLR